MGSISDFILGLIAVLFLGFAGCNEVAAPVESAPPPAGAAAEARPDTFIDPAGSYEGQMQFATGDNEYIMLTVSYAADTDLYTADLSVADSDDSLTMPCTYTSPRLECSFQADDEPMYFRGEVTETMWLGETSTPSRDAVGFTLNRP